MRRIKAFSKSRVVGTRALEPGREDRVPCRLANISIARTSRARIDCERSVRCRVRETSRGPSRGSRTWFGCNGELSRGGSRASIARIERGRELRRSPSAPRAACERTLLSLHRAGRRTVSWNKMRGFARTHEISLAKCCAARLGFRAMNPRLRRILFLGICSWVVCGLVLCGPAHHALHELSAGGAHASISGIYCDGCSLNGLAYSEPGYSCGPERWFLLLRQLAPVQIPSSAPLLHRSPRGPPRTA
jgi:hypothetical protein